MFLSSSLSRCNLVTAENPNTTGMPYLLDKNGNAAIFARYGMEGPEIADEVRKLLAE